MDAVRAPVPPAAMLGADDARIAELRRDRSAAAPVRAARELEAVFLTLVLRAMRRTVPESDFLPKAPSRDVYDGMFDRAVAETLAAEDPLGLVPALTPKAGLKSGPEPADDRGGRSPGGAP